MSIKRELFILERDTRGPTARGDINRQRRGGLESAFPPLNLIKNEIGPKNIERNKFKFTKPVHYQKVTKTTRLVIEKAAGELEGAAAGGGDTMLPATPLPPAGGHQGWGGAKRNGPAPPPGPAGAAGGRHRPWVGGAFGGAGVEGCQTRGRGEGGDFN